MTSFRTATDCVSPATNGSFPFVSPSPRLTQQTATVTCFLCRRKVRERTREKRHQRKESERSVLSKTDGLTTESKLVTPTSQATFQLSVKHTVLFPSSFCFSPAVASFSLHSSGSCTCINLTEVSRGLNGAREYP